MVLENLLGTVSVVQLVKRTINAALGDVATQTWPRGYETFSCSTQLSMKFVMLINLKLLTIADSFLLNIDENENSSANKYEKAFSYLLTEKILCSAELSMKKVL